MLVEILQNEEISRRGKNGGREEVSSTIRRKKAKNRGTMNIKEKERGGVV